MGYVNSLEGIDSLVMSYHLSSCCVSWADHQSPNNPMSSDHGQESVSKADLVEIFVELCRFGDLGTWPERLNQRSCVEWFNNWQTCKKMYLKGSHFQFYGGIFFWRTCFCTFIVVDHGSFCWYVSLNGSQWYKSDLTHGVWEQLYIS